MCRIAYIPRPGLVEERDLLDLFSYLENRQGGEGNGLAMMWDESEMGIIKGLSASAEELAMMAMYSVGPVLFHTRRATSGGVCDALCQPFLLDGVATAHNGVWRDWDDIAIQLILQDKLDGDAPINDSLTAATLASKFGRYALETISLGVFVVMTAKGAWLHLRSGSFEFCPDLGIYASEFPKKDWPKAKPIATDSIAFLSADGPQFECGGWRTWTYVAGAKIPGGSIVAGRQMLMPDDAGDYTHIHYLGDSRKKPDDDEDPVAEAQLAYLKRVKGEHEKAKAADEDDAAEAQLVEYYQRKYYMEEA